MRWCHHRFPTSSFRITAHLFTTFTHWIWCENCDLFKWKEINVEVAFFYQYFNLHAWSQKRSELLLFITLPLLQPSNKTKNVSVVRRKKLLVSALIIKGLHTRPWIQRKCFHGNRASIQVWSQSTYILYYPSTSYTVNVTNSYKKKALQDKRPQVEHSK